MLAGMALGGWFFWHAGRKWPFRLPLPVEGPITYAGTLYQVEWFVRAVVDRLLRRDLRMECPLQVRPRTGESTW